MATALEDELRDVLQKAREGKSLSIADVAKNSGVFLEDVLRVENEGEIPSDDVILKLAAALDLHGESLVAVARGSWTPLPPQSSPDFDVICLDLLMGLYPVKCYLLKCNKTSAVAVIDTGGNPEAVIGKVRELGMAPSQILLTHCHADHAGGVHILEKEFDCVTWSDKAEPMPSGCKKLKTVKEGNIIELGRLRIHSIATPGHTHGGVSYRVDKAVFSGDVIFAGSMGRANSSFQKLFQAVSQKILTLPEDTVLYPGHGPATTVGEEKLHNPFFCGKV